MATDDRHTLEELLRRKGAFQEWLLQQENTDTTGAVTMLIDNLPAGATEQRVEVISAVYDLLPSASLSSQQLERIREIARNLLESPSPVERSYALDLLRECPLHVEDIDAAVVLLQDHDALVRVSAIDLLGTTAYRTGDDSLCRAFLGQFLDDPDPILVGTGEAYRVLVGKESVDAKALLDLGEEAVGAFARVVWEVWDPEDGPSVDQMHSQVSELATGLWKASPDAIAIVPLMDELDALREGQSQEPGGWI